MKEVYFKQIMIADLQNKTARVQPFEKGLNVVTSIDNHVGKAVNSSVANANSEWARAGEKVRNFGNTEDAEKTSNKSDYKF